MGDTFTCRECGKTGPYYEVRKSLNPRTRKTACEECCLAAEGRGPAAGYFDVARNYKAPGASQKAAQAAAKSAALNDTHRRIWKALRAQPSTADEISAALGLVLNTARARISDLRSQGFVEDTGETRLTAAGKEATVWRAVSQRAAA